MNDDDDTQEYAHQRQWVGLTHEDMMLLVEQARKTPAKGPCIDQAEAVKAGKFRSYGKNNINDCEIMSFGLHI